MAEAKLNREYALRLLGVGALMIGIGVWSIYDGQVAWPRKNSQLEAVRPALLATNLTAEAWLAVDNGSSPLAKVFAARGFAVPSKLVKKVGELRLPDRITGDRDEKRAAFAKRLTEVFKAPVYSEHDLGGQTVQACIGFLLGLLAIGSIVLKFRTCYIADNNGLSGNGFGGNYAYSDISKIDWGKWDDKGIAYLYMKDKRLVKLDGWHFAGTPAIMAAIAEHRPDLARKPSSPKA